MEAGCHRARNEDFRRRCHPLLVVNMHARGTAKGRRIESKASYGRVSCVVHTAKTIKIPRRLIHSITVRTSSGLQLDAPCLVCHRGSRRNTSISTRKHVYKEAQAKATMSGQEHEKLDNKRTDLRSRKLRRRAKACGQSK
eukprot:6185768-Pleurochrysis_carterae.AAC.5